MPAICHNRRTTTFYNFSTTFEAKRMAQEDTRRMKKISRIEYCAGFEPLQSGMEQDEGSRILLPTMKSLDSSTSKKADGKAEGAQTVGDNNGFFTPNSKIDFSNVKIEPLFEEAVDFETFSKSDFRAVKVKECVAVPKSKKLLQFTLDDGTGTDRTILSGIHAYYEPEELVGKTLIAITNLLMVDNHIPAGAKLY